MKTSFTLTSTLLAFISLTLFSSLSAQELTNRILAKINGKVITSFDVVKLTRQQERKMQQTLPPTKRDEAIKELRKSALNHLIDNELILKEFADKQFRVPQTYLETRLEKVIAQEANGDRIKFNQSLRKSNLTLAEYRAKLEESISVEMLINEMVKRKIIVTDSEIDSYYKENINAFSSKGTYDMQAILLKTENLQDPRVQAIDLALTNNKNFTEIAKEYNKGNGLPADGKLGKLSEEDLRPEFLKAIKTLKDGETAKALVLEGNTYFLHLIKKSGTEIKTLDTQLKSKIRRRLEKLEENKIYDDFIKDLRQRSAIEVYL